MVDANGRQTITNDGATVMKVGFTGITIGTCGHLFADQCVSHCL